MTSQEAKISKKPQKTLFLPRFLIFQPIPASAKGQTGESVVGAAGNRFVFLQFPANPASGLAPQRTLRFCRLKNKKPRWQASGVREF